MRSMLLTAAFAAGALGPVCALGALNACGDDSQVPFGLEDEDPNALPPGSNPEDGPFEPVAGEALAAGTRSVAIEGAPLRTDGSEVRSLLATDFDGDGDRDALLLEVADSQVTLSFARREGSAFGPINAIGDPLPSDEACTVAEVELTHVAEALAIGRSARTCGDDRRDESLWIVSVEATPRVHEQVVLLPKEGRAEGDVTVAMRVIDRDEDGHLDVVLDVSVSSDAGGEPARASMAWLDRPSGLARETTEPEASIAALAEGAAAVLADDPEAGLATARRALALHDALCRDGAAPRVRFGASDGISCGASAGAGRAAAVATAALAQRGAVFEALDAFARLDHPGYSVGRQSRRLATRAITAMATTEGLSRWTGPPVTLPPGPAARLPMVAFLDATHLLVHGAAPKIIDLAAPDAPPTMPHQGTSELLVDPTGQYAVTAIARSCAGHELVIVRARDVVAGVVAGRPHARALLAAAAPPAGSRCPSTALLDEDDDGGYRILGWAPQGVVAVRGAELRVVPLDVDAQPTGESRALAADDPAPAPLHGGAAALDGSAYALATPHGIAVHVRGGRTRLLRPEGFEAGTVTPADVALSPALDRVAYVAGGRVHAIAFPPPGPN